MPKLVNDWPYRYAQAFPDRVMTTEPARGLSLTWGEADRQAGALAGFFRTEGKVGVGDRVAVLAESRLETVSAFFAVPRLRATLVPLNTKLSVPELARVFSDAQPKVFLVAGALAGMASEILSAYAKERPLAPKPVVVALDPPVGGTLGGVVTFAQALAAPRVTTEAVVEEDDAWLVLYTSGSTGVPKGALVTHRQIVWNALHTLVACDIRHDDATVIYTPLFYTGGWNVLTTPLWYHGAKVHLLPAFDAPRIVDMIARERLTLLFGVPTTLAAMRDTPAFATADLSSLRVVLAGGAACPPALIETYNGRGIALRQGYGLTEVGPNCFGVRPEDAIRKCGSIGRPNLHLEWKVINEAGESVREGGEGELRLRGPTVFGGYLGNESATRAAFDEEGFFKTGDIVKVDDEGQFWIVGRKNDMFKSGGEKVYAGEIESAVAAHEAVAEVVVFGVPDEKWGEVGRAVIVKRPGAALDTEALRSWLQTRIARFKVPKTFVLVDALPRLETGKIARAKVKERWGLAAGGAPASSKPAQAVSC